jgi:flagellar basal-body rod protein FlgB
MMLNNVLSSGALPSLEMTIRFASQRNKLIGHNIANISTPNFEQKDVSPQDFQKWLSQAVSERRERTGGMHGELKNQNDRQFVQRKDGGIELNPLSSGGGVLAHDRNNRDLEQLMQDLSENLSAYQVATDLMRSQIGTLRVAITQRA